MNEINELFLAVIQVEDQNRTIFALKGAGFEMIEMMSIGGLLGRKSVTLLLGINHDQIDLAVSIIKQNCQLRTEYISTPLEGIPLPIPIATPITIGGAIIFSLPLEQALEVY